MILWYSEVNIRTPVVLLTDNVLLNAFAALVLARNFCMALLGFDGGVYTVVTVNDFCFWSFDGGAFLSVPDCVPFWGALDIVTGNASAATAGSPTGPGGADTALIFGSINFTVGPTSVEKGERGGQMGKIAEYR